MKAKKIVALTMAIAMMAGVVACGGTNQGENKGGESGSKYDWSKGADASGGEVTLKVATWRKHDQPYYEEIVKRFEEKYDWINVELEFNPDSNSYYSNLQADIVDGTAPDVFDCHPNNKMLTYVEEGVIAPQTDFDYIENYDETAKKVTTINGDNYGYMNAYNYFGFLYNKAAFAKAGIEIPKTPEALVEANNKLKTAGYGGVVFAGGTYSSRAIGNIMYLISMGFDGYTSMLNDIDTGKITDISKVDGVENALSTVQYYVDNDLWYQGYEGITYEAGLSLFAQEKAAIVYSGSYIFGEQDVYFPNIETGFFPVPTYANNGKTYSEGATTSLIYSQGENLGAAKLWIEFLATAEISEYYCSNAKMLSTIKGVTSTFDEAEMLLASSTGYEMVPIEDPENGEYWSNTFTSIVDRILYTDGNWEDLVRKFKNQLEDFKLGDR